VVVMESENTSVRSLCLCASVVQTLPSLSFSVAILWWIRLQPLTEEAEHSRDQIEGDNHQHNDEQTPRHRQMVTGEC